MKRHPWTIALCCLAAPLLAGSAPAFAKTGLLSSSAALFTGSITVGGISVPFSQITAAGTTLAGPYSVATNVPSLGQIVYLPSASAPVLGLSVMGTTIDAAVSGSTQGAAFASGAISFAAATVALLPPTAGEAPYLSVAITNAAAMSTYMPAGSAQGTAYGGATLGTLVISGSWLKGKTITAPLNAAPNTVLYAAHGVKVVVNDQLAVKPLGCGSSCATLPQGLEIDGVRLSLTNVSINGQTLSGNIEIAQGVAN